jgi:hypothetical protein
LNFHLITLCDVLITQLRIFLRRANIKWFLHGSQICGGPIPALQGAKERAMCYNRWGLHTRNIPRVICTWNKTISG